MTARTHPLRRSYAPELALGVVCAVIAAWLLVGREPGARAPGEARDGAPATARDEPPPRTDALLAEPAEAGLAREAAPSEAATAGAAAEEGKEPPTDPAVENASPGQLVVLVLHASGRPASGVPLVFEPHLTPTSRGAGRALPLTDESGRSSLPLAWFEPPALPGPYRYVLRVLLPLPKPPEVDFGAGPPGLASVTLVLPPGGRVHARVLAEDERPVEGGASVYATVRSANGERVTGTAEVHSGLAVFPCVALDSELELRASFDDQRAPAGHLTLRGPTFLEETIECELRLGAEWPLLRFRVVDERGRPLESAKLALRVTLDPLSPQLAGVRADPEGCVALRLMASRVAVRERRLELDTDEPEPRGAEVSLPFELERGRPTDLGDLVLYPRARRP